MQNLNIEEPFKGKIALLELGFRPFFLLAGLSSVVLMLTWGAAMLGYGNYEHYYGGLNWHSHEMLYGYTVAVIAGFLLTAVKNWTNRQTARNLPLAILAIIWLSSRILPLIPNVPGWLIATLDLSFIPGVAIAIGIALYHSKNYKNFIFLGILTALFCGNLLMHLEALGISNTAGHGARLGLYLIVLIISVLGGRVIPFFTERAVSGFQRKALPHTDILVLISTIGFALSAAIAPQHAFTAILASLAGFIQLIRYAGWYTHGIWRVPLLWSIHTGYQWMIAGLFLYSLSYLQVFPYYSAIHAITVGGIGGLTVGMMARVSLGHTGRHLLVNKATIVGFALINIACAIRVFMPALAPKQYSLMIQSSAGLWALAFCLFSASYALILIKPRVDGRPG